MSQIVIGVDPGATGALAVIESGSLVRVDDMPTTTRRGGGLAVNPALLRDLIREILRAHNGAYFIAAIEDVHAMPGQGVSSMFAFGRSLGQIEAVLLCMGLPITWVRPQAWKKAAGLIGAEKDAARTVAIERWPTRAEAFKRKKDCGRADAALIAAHVARGL